MASAGDDFSVITKCRRGEPGHTHRQQCSERGGERCCLRDALVFSCDECKEPNSLPKIPGQMSHGSGYRERKNNGNIKEK